MAVVAAHEAPGASVTGEVACRVVWGAVGSGKRFFFFFFLLLLLWGGAGLRWSGAAILRRSPQRVRPALLSQAVGTESTCGSHGRGRQSSVSSTAASGCGYPGFKPT